MSLTQLNGILGIKKAAHLLRRATFGPTKAQIDSFANLTATQAINILFTPNPASNLTTTPLDSQGQTWANVPPNSDIMDGELQESFKGWWIGKMLADGMSANNPSAFEKVVFFLHTHFTTNQEKVGNAKALYFQNALFREFAFDQGKTAAPNIRNFKELAKKLCLDNAMLIFLDGTSNVKGSVNENYAREFLELYTIGKGLDNKYPDTGDRNDYFYFKEADVRTAARVLSGFTTDLAFATLDNTGNSITNLPRGIATPAQHDNESKTFSNRFNDTVITPTVAGNNPTEASMLKELDDLLDMIFNQEEAKRNICRKIYRYFVYYNITNTIENTIISEMVSTFVNSGYRIEPVIRELLGSQHFYDSVDAEVKNDNFGAIIKSPFELIIGTLRFFELPLPNYQTQTEDFYKITSGIIAYAFTQGLNFMNPFDVAGYEAYFQVPIYNRSWISTNSLTRRYEFISKITLSTELEAMFGMNTNQSVRYYLDFFKSKYPQNSATVTFDFLIRELTKYLFPLQTENTEITPERYAYFHTRFETGVMDAFGGLNPLASWNFNWDNLPEPDTLNKAIIFILNSILQSPEYQLF